MDIYKGENIIVEGSITDRNGNAVNFTTLTEVTATVQDSYKKTVAFTKTAGTVTAGSTSDSYRLEITQDQTSNSLDGVISLFLNIQFTDTDYSLNTVDVKKITIGQLKIAP